MKLLGQCSAKLEKCPSGINGLDEITGGGLPRGRPTLVCGDAGSGKTILAMQFLVRGITEFGEPGVFIAFEESAEELATNMSSMDIDLQRLSAENKLAIDWVHLEGGEVPKTGDFNLQALFVRIQSALQRVHARRIVLDSIEALFAALPDHKTLRSELERLFYWLKQPQLTAIVTAERGEGRLTRMGLEAYVADCVICLDHEVVNQISTRHLRVAKYRGSMHGANQYPFLISDKGFSVFPITSVGLACPASTEIVSSGIPQLDVMLQRGGFYRGSSILISGTSGAGKTSMAAHFIHAACARGERALYFAFEESRDQIIRNMNSIGIDLAPWQESGCLQFHTARPSLCGLETHLATIIAAVESFAPHVLVLDPLTDLVAVASEAEVKAMLTRLLDYLKMKQVTSVFTSLTVADHDPEQSEAGVSSLIDCWLLVRNLEQNGERNRTLYLLKSRGMAHSTQVREFLLTDAGIDLVDVCVNDGKVVTGSARREYEARQRQAAQRLKEEISRKGLELERQRRELETQVQAMRDQFKEHELEVQLAIQAMLDIEERGNREAKVMTHSRENEVVPSASGDAKAAAAG